MSLILTATNTESIDLRYLLPTVVVIYSIIYSTSLFFSSTTLAVVASRYDTA
jgi:hypothetical protein